ncbi:chemotaxis protein CheA [Cesiribacter sp. SM1]|uniref:chemotaxis protein CheA n=1 Tax=Cesiribacter sp. SM1 TaxID=2861196 RepID=UPI001CD2283B|nr:chemotaxis protein CheA [Cesiribacter sp. SM1]
MDFQQEYIEEVSQIIKNLEMSLMRLEENPGHPEEIDNVYRYLHTLKGSAGMFDFHQVERLTHELEYIYSDIREGIRTQDDFILDITLHAVDVLLDLIDGRNADSEVEKIVETLRTLRGEGVPEKVSAADAGKPSSSSRSAFVIFLKPESNLFKRGINLTAILDDIEELGSMEVIIHNEEIPLEKQLQIKELHSWFEIILITAQGMSGILDVFMFLKDQEYEILTIEAQEDFGSEQYSKHIQLSEASIQKRIEKLLEWDSEIFNNQTPEPTATGAEVLLLKVDGPLITEEEFCEEEVQSELIQKSKKAKGQVNVSTPKLDQLIDIVSELVTFRSELQHLMGESESPQVIEAMEKLEFLTLRLRDSAFNIRLVPLNILQVKFQRLIRSVSKELGKEIEFITEGLGTELDRSIISALEAPLMHIIRNAIDHGIESPEERVKRNKPAKGLLKLYSYNSGDHVFIQIQDDGNGIDFEKIREKGITQGFLNQQQTYSEKELLNVVMASGFSTADKVSTISGRGVGMDIVKKEVNALRGDIEISTEKGLGSIITLRLPLTLTILDTLVVKVADQKYLIPINEIEYCFTEQHTQLFSKKSRQITYENQSIPFFSLREYFGKEGYPTQETVIVVNKNDARVAIVVDSILGQYQTVYKPLNELLQSVDCFSGASILGDGSTALILNVLKLKSESYA